VGVYILLRYGVPRWTSVANAKVWSTLGGTTGLGAVTSSINSNASTDQTGLAAINTALNAFLTFVKTGGPNKGPADNELIYITAPIYAGQCTAAATASPSTPSK